MHQLGGAGTVLRTRRGGRWLSKLCDAIGDAIGIVGIPGDYIARSHSRAIGGPILLNILYDPRVKVGMTIDETKTVLPEVLVTARAYVRQLNGLTR